jgi:hypothetical protein
MKCGCKQKTRDMRRAVAAKLELIFGKETVLRRKPCDGPGAPDVMASQVAITCVRGARTDARAGLREAMARHRYPDEWVVAVLQDDGQRPYVAMTFEDFLPCVAQGPPARRGVGGGGPRCQTPSSVSCLERYPGCHGGDDPLPIRCA